MKKARITSMIIAVCLILSTFSIAVSADGNVQKLNGIVSEVIGNIRVQILSDSLVRIEERGPSGFEDRETFHIQNRTDWDGAEVSKTVENGLTEFATKDFTVAVAGSAPTLSDVKIHDTAGGLLWEYTGLGENKVYLPDANELTDMWEIFDTPRTVPAEWGFQPAPAGNTENAETNGWDLSNDAPDIYVFLPGGDHKLLRSDFVNLTGRTEMLPLSALGAWDSRYYAYSEQTALAQVEGYHSRNLPLDNLVIDTDWRESSNGMGYDVNTSLFPDMEGFLRTVDNMGVNVIFNDHPEPTVTNGNRNNAISPTEVAYRFPNLTKILQMGVDAWWYDRNWSSTIVPIAGHTHEVIGMATYAQAQKAVYPDKRLFMMSNVDGNSNGYNVSASNIAAHRYSVQWTGDTNGGQESIFQELTSAINRGMNSALPYVSTDLGTHNTKSVSITDDEYLRWIQFGALSPIFRLHVSNPDTGRMPWLRGDEVTDIYRDYLNLRYRMLPVFYDLSRENYDTGMPMLRSMTFDYPEYIGADTSDQYMLGDDILVAPVVDSAAGGAVPPSWLTAPDGSSGVRAEYFNNTNLSGNPVLTRNESQIDFNWGEEKPHSSVNGDNFSIRFTTTLSVNSETDIRLMTKSDDGCRVYVDGQLILDRWQPLDSGVNELDYSFEAGKTYSIVFEYYEGTGKALCQLNYFYNTNGTSRERTVWIPEGEWIDTISGETVFGPRTVSVQCELEQMPIYIRKGAVIPLADETLTVEDSDWSHLTLDYYPSTRQEGSARIYEDDTESTDYESGLYRTTEITSSFDGDDGVAVLDIGAAQGSFDGDLCFDEREWTIRVHGSEGWGELLSAELSDGTKLSFTAITADSGAMPLMNSGGATDGTVYEIHFNSDVKKAVKLNLRFASIAEPAVPEYDYDQPMAAAAGINKTGAVERDVAISENLPAEVNLTEQGSKSWLFAGYAVGVVEKLEPNARIEFSATEEVRQMYDYTTAFSWSDGSNGIPVYSTHNGGHSTGLGSVFNWSVVAEPGEQELNLYIGGWHSAGRLEIYDASGKTVSETYEFSNINGSFYREVKIKFAAQERSRLYIKYSLTNANSGEGNITFAGATLADTGRNITADTSRLDVLTSSAAKNGWSPRPVTLYLFSNDEAADGYEVLLDGIWSPLSGNSYTYTADTLSELRFRAVDVNGSALSEATYTVGVDASQPKIYLSGRVGEDGTASIDPSSGGTASETTIYLSVDGGRWTIWDGEPVSVPKDSTSSYRFKAVSQSGIESGMACYVYGDSFETVTKGDLDDSGKINVSDVVALRQLIMSSAWTEKQLAAGDMDGNGTLNVNDVVALRSLIMRA